MPAFSRRSFLGSLVATVAAPIVSRLPLPGAYEVVRGWHYMGAISMTVSNEARLRLSGASIAHTPSVANEIEARTGGRILAPRSMILAPPRRTAIARASQSEIDRYGRRIIPVRSMIERPSTEEVRRYA